MYRLHFIGFGIAGTTCYQSAYQQQQQQQQQQ